MRGINIVPCRGFFDIVSNVRLHVLRVRGWCCPERSLRHLWLVLADKLKADLVEKEVQRKYSADAAKRKVTADSTITYTCPPYTEPCFPQHAVTHR